MHEEEGRDVHNMGDGWRAFVQHQHCPSAGVCRHSRAGHHNMRCSGVVAACGKEDQTTCSA